MAENEEHNHMEFVVIELSRKQIDIDHPVKNDKNGKEYVRIYAPGGGSFLYPKKSLKTREDSGTKMYFTRPKGTELQLRFSEKIEGVPDNVLAKDKYSHYTRMVKIEELKEMYQEARQAFLDSIKDHPAEVVETNISEKLVRYFKSKAGRELAEVSVPVYVSADDKKATFYKIIVHAEKIKPADGDGVVQLEMYKKGIDGNDYTFTAKRSVKDAETGEYKNIEKKITSAEVVDAFRESKERYRSSMAEKEQSLADEKNETKDADAQSQKMNDQQRRRRGR